MIKYIAQILLEVELTASKKSDAEIQAGEVAKGLAKVWTLPTTVINTHIITEPSDEEFLNRIFEYKGELYEMMD